MECFINDLENGIEHTCGKFVDDIKLDRNSTHFREQD